MKNDIVYIDRFIWDIKKAETNKKKHKLSFEVACRVFNDPALYVIYVDEHSSKDEDRYICIGAIDGTMTIITVSITEREEYTRIISARKATGRECRYYEENAAKL